MRIKTVGIVRVSQKPVLGQTVGHRHHIRAGGQHLKQIHQLRLQVKTVPKDQVRICQCRDVTARLPIGMRVKPRPHQCPDLATPDPARSIRNHARCGDHLGHRA